MYYIIYILYTYILNYIKYSHMYNIYIKVGNNIYIIFCLFV